VPLHSNPRNPVATPRYAIVGRCGSAGARPINHIGILRDQAQVAPRQIVAVDDWQPPLGNPGWVRADAIGWIDLDDEARYGLESWLEEKKVLQPLPPTTWTPWDQYILSPAFDEVLDEHSATDRIKRHRYSCAGFVERAYAEGARTPLVVDPPLLPLVDLDMLRGVWGLAFRAAGKTEAVLPSLGLSGPGPWRVLLPGYLLAACRSAAPRPYQPRVADASCGEMA